MGEATQGRGGDEGASRRQGGEPPSAVRHPPHRGVGAVFEGAPGGVFVCAFCSGTRYAHRDLDDTRAMHTQKMGRSPPFAIWENVFFRTLN